MDVCETPPSSVVVQQVGHLNNNNILTLCSDTISISLCWVSHFCLTWLSIMFFSCAVVLTDEQEDYKRTGRDQIYTTKGSLNTEFPLPWLAHVLLHKKVADSQLKCMFKSCLINTSVITAEHQHSWAFKKTPDTPKWTRDP